MTYQNSANQTPVTIDGVPDTVSTAVPTWELATGPQGSVMVVGQVSTSIIPVGGTLDTIADGFYRDEAASPVDQCWGDPDFRGASGLNIVAAIPNTTRPVPATLDSNDRMAPAAPGQTAATTSTWANNVNPVSRTVTSRCDGDGERLA
jgi:hypothetical protein